MMEAPEGHVPGSAGGGICREPDGSEAGWGDGYVAGCSPTVKPGLLQNDGWLSGRMREHARRIVPGQIVVGS